MGEPVYSDVRGLIRKCDCLALGSLYFSPDPQTLKPFVPPHPPPTPLKQGLVHPVGP